VAPRLLRTNPARRARLPGGIALLILAGSGHDARGAAPVSPQPWGDAPRPASRLLGVLSDAEASLDRVTREARAGVRIGILEGLRDVAAAHPGSVVSGLAHIEMADLALANGRHAEAVSLARHPDVDRTELRDHALLIVARAQARQGDVADAAAAYVAAADAARSDSVRCDARRGAAGAFARLPGQGARRLAALEDAARLCTLVRPETLLDLGEAKAAAGDVAGALAALEEIESSYPTTEEAERASLELARLMGLGRAGTAKGAKGTARDVAGRTLRQDFEKRLARSRELLDSSRMTAARGELRPLLAHPALRAGADQEEVLVGLARSLPARSAREAKALIARVPADSPFRAEADLVLARLAPEARRADLYRAIVDRFPRTRAAEQALFALGNLFQKDALHDDAAPYYRQLAVEFPDSAHAERSALRAAFSAVRQGRPGDAADVLENMARRSRSPGGFLYWAGVARGRTGDDGRARALLTEAATRFRNTWYGLNAAAALERLPVSESEPPLAFGEPPRAPDALDGAIAVRVRQMLLAGLHEEALVELSGAPETAATWETRALIQADRGELRSAIIAMKRAYPGHAAALPADLPPHAWTTIYPLRYDAGLRAAAAREGLDPSLVAALICQESTFTADAVSSAGARGLMQIMTYTGRPLARDLGLRFDRRMLLDPGTSLTLGSRYFRQMIDRFGREDAALAAYNAGPHRVDRWLPASNHAPADEFVESIPFSETRGYVMTILGARAQYERLYGLRPAPPASAQ
jgi:soluble lytic murein transglycosylase